MRMIIVCLFMLFAIADDLSAQIMRMGQSPSGNIILTMDKNRIRRGNSPSGEIVMTIDGERISNEKGKMNNKSDDAKYMELITNLRTTLKVLAANIAPKVYEYGFLKK